MLYISDIHVTDHANEIITKCWRWEYILNIDDDDDETDYDFNSKHP